jgi:predicted DsbA family dithiol-disulfide isomerase
MHSQMTQTAKEMGLVYDFDKAIPANTFKAHQLIQFAKAHGKQEEAEETVSTNIIISYDSIVICYLTSFDLYIVFTCHYNVPTMR